MTQTPDTLRVAVIKATPMLDRVVARAKAATTSVTADELAQLSAEVKNAGGRLRQVGPSHYVVPLPDPTGAGNGGSLEVVVDVLAQAASPTAEVAAARDQVTAMLDSYHAPTLLLAAVKCERAALLDQARAGEWIERSGRLRELARAACAIGC